ncbi:MAG: hypothetical protein WCL02_08590 [bacterium]
MPVSIFIVVDFPAPLGQRNAIFSHFSTEKFMEATASNSLYSG